MAGGGSSKATRLRKRVEAESSSLKRAKDGSAFAKCEECNKDVPVALISFHNCSLDARIKMNLETQVVEIPSEAKKKPASEKKKTKSTSTKENKEKKAKNESGRKRPTTAFFLFMKEFRKTFKEENPDSKGVTMVAKEAGEKWKSMTDEEKKVYTDKAAELKAEFEKNTESNDAEEIDDEKVADDEPEVEEEQEINKEEQEGKEKRRRLRKKTMIVEEDEEIKEDVEEIKDEDVNEEIKEVNEQVKEEEQEVKEEEKQVENVE